MALARGTRLGPYEVIAPLGAGGMGEVYRATDTKLNREVALKVLPDALAGDPQRLARLHREAQVLASLNHPSIAAIYGIEDAEATHALVLELVEGPTLADRIVQSPIPVDEALPIAKQIAEALEAAHEQGIIHRDLKPANIKVRPDGTVKVLDFGLAKAMEPASTLSPRLSQSPTITTPAMTQAGMILGSAAYMSPEQAKGRPVDKRSDVWAFGCVLYEMLVGRRAFEGEDVADTLVAVMSKEPDWRALPTALPATQVAFLKQCLEKNLRQRLPDIGAMRLAIEGAFETASASAASASPVRPLWRVVLPSVAGIGLAVVTGLAVWAIARPVPPSPARVRRFQETLPEGLTLSSGSGSLVALSPDGQTLVYRAFARGQRQLYRRRLDAVSSEAVAGTEGADGLPFFSPDGQWLGFQVGPGLMKVPLVGGRPVRIGEVPGFTGASWETDGSIILGARSAGLVRIPAAGGPAVSLTKPTGGRWDLYPQSLPGSRTVLFTSSIQAPNAGDLKGLDVATGTEQILLRNAVAGRYLPGGDLVFVRGGDLWAVRFDPIRLSVQGEPVRLESGIRVEGGGSVQMALAADGTLAYIPASGSVGIGRTLVWVTRDGHEEPIPAPARAYVSPRLSPDTTRVALTIREQDYDIWIWDLRRDTLTRLTVDAAPDESPVWTPDGKRVVFASTRRGPMNLFAQAADGTGMVERLTDSPNSQFPSAFSPDGRVLVLDEAQPNTGLDLRVFAGAGDRQVTDLLATPFTESNAALSPDGRWVAYQANPSGRPEIYVRPFPDVNQGQWQISADGGTQPLWSRDGRELFYRNGDGLMVVPIGGDPRTAGRPHQLFTGDYDQGDGRRAYDAAPDGARFLMIKQAKTQSPARSTITIVEQWRTQFDRLLPMK